MKLEDCKEGMKVRYEFEGGIDYGTITEHEGSIFTYSGNVWVKWDGDWTLHSAPEYLTEIKEESLDTERKYTKEEIIEYMEHIGYVNVEANIQDIEDYFSADNEDERKAAALLKSKGYTIIKN